jgi:hypothetical protein
VNEFSFAMVSLCNPSLQDIQEIVNRKEEEKKQLTVIQQGGDSSKQLAVAGNSNGWILICGKFTCREIHMPANSYRGKFTWGEIPLAGYSYGEIFTWWEIHMSGHSHGGKFTWLENLFGGNVAVKYTKMLIKPNRWEF